MSIKNKNRIKNGFKQFACPTHGIYYKSLHEVFLFEEEECHFCQFLGWDGFEELFALSEQNPEDEEADFIEAIFYKLDVHHKPTGLRFQKIGSMTIYDEESTHETLYEDFKAKWDKWKWKDFEITPIDVVIGTPEEVEKLEKEFKRFKADKKITIPQYIKFNTNGTYETDYIWAAKPKTIKVLRDIYSSKQNNKCTICGRPIKDGTLDHQHQKKVKGSGFIRAVCCSSCNTFIARSENNAARHNIPIKDLPAVLRRMADHIENEKNIIHPTEVPPRKKVSKRDWNRIVKYYFKAFPNRKVLPKKPIYENDTYFALKEQIDEYIAEQERLKEERRKNRKRRKS